MAVTMTGSSEDLMRAVFQKVRLVDVKFQSEPDFNRPKSLPRIKSLPPQRPVSQPAEEIFHSNGVNSSRASHEPAEFNCVIVRSQEDGDEPQFEVNGHSPEANLTQSDEDEPQTEADGLSSEANRTYPEGDEPQAESVEPPMSYEHVYDYRTTPTDQVDEGTKPQPTTSHPFKSAERDQLMAELKLRHASLKAQVDVNESDEKAEVDEPVIEEGEMGEDIEDPILEAVFEAVQLRHPILMNFEKESIKATVDLSDEESPNEGHHLDESPVLSPASDNLHLEITFSPASDASHPTYELPSVQIDSAREGDQGEDADEMVVLPAREEAINTPGMAEDHPIRVETASTRIESSQLERISSLGEVEDTPIPANSMVESGESTHQSVISPVKEVVIRVVEAGGSSSPAKLVLGSLEPSRQDQIRTELGIGSTSPGAGIKDLVERFSHVHQQPPTSKPPPMSKRQSVIRFALPPLDLSHGRGEDEEGGSGHRRYVKTPHPTSRQSSAGYLLGDGSRVIGAGEAMDERDFQGYDHPHDYTIPAAPPSSVREEENPNTLATSPTKAIDEDRDEERQRSVQELREKFSSLPATGNGKAQPATTTTTTAMKVDETKEAGGEANAGSTPPIRTPSSAHIGFTSPPTSVSFTSVRLRSTGHSLTMADSTVENSSPPPLEQVLPNTRMEKSKSSEGTFALENAASKKVAKSGGLSVRTSAEMIKPPVPKQNYYNFYSGSEVAANWKKKANSDSNGSTNSVDGTTPAALVEIEPPIGSLAAIRRSLSSVLNSPISPSVGSNGSINTGQAGKKSWATTVGAYPPPSPGSSPSNSPTPFNNSMEKPQVVRNFNVPSSPSAVRNFYKVWGSKKSTSPPPSGQNGGK